MRMPFGKISASLALAGTAIAQNAPAQATETPPPPKAEQSDTPSPKPTGTDTSAALDYLMNRKPQDGSAGKQALDASKRAETKAVAEDAVGIPRQEDSEVRARFERYLGTAQVPQEKLDEYFGKMKEVSNLLRDNQIFPAWKQLHDVADYTIIDAGTVAHENQGNVAANFNSSPKQGGHSALFKAKQDANDIYNAAKEIEDLYSSTDETDLKAQDNSAVGLVDNYLAVAGQDPLTGNIDSWVVSDFNCSTSAKSYNRLNN